MKTAELRNLSDEELRQRLADTRQELFNLRIQKATSQVERPLRLRLMRREIARMETIVRQRAIKQAR